MELIINIINGVFNNYAEVKVPTGYCFYDAEVEDRSYMTSIFTPIIDEDILRKKFIVVQGDADIFNEELQKVVEDDR